MGVYKARRFSQSTKKLGIHDKVLMAAAEEVMQGIWEADLGSGVIKKRLPLQQGKSGGARTIIFFKSANHVFFYDGWSKSGLSSKGTKEIEDDELAAGNDSNLLIVFYVQIMPDDFVMQLHRF
ncbi:type II toxin-antitoxin system RelE/ParE family toxin [Escherichia coli]|uniref:type II toxin-antitoxin system RelE/ParE family toxin n=1 Tax=Escherichia coli TaxID=562 RepID=UPI003CD03EA2